MNRLVEKYGRIIIVCSVAAVVFLIFGEIGMKLYEKMSDQQPENAEEIDTDMRLLAEQKKYPFFCGSRYITLTLGYKGTDKVEGFSREDALSFVEAYEYNLVNGQEVIEKIDKNKIKIYPFDDETHSIREFVDVKNTGKYSVRYSVEGESGLKSDMVMLVLVDILPEGMECKESVGAENESGS